KLPLLCEPSLTVDSLADEVAHLPRLGVDDRGTPAAKPKVGPVRDRRPTVVVFGECPTLGSFRSGGGWRTRIDFFLLLRIEVASATLHDLGDEIDSLLAIAADAAARPDRVHLKLGYVVSIAGNAVHRVIRIRNDAHAHRQPVVRFQKSSVGIQPP